MTNTEYAIKIFNWITNNTNPETEKEVYINGVLKRFPCCPSAISRYYPTVCATE